LIDLLVSREGTKCLFPRTEKYPLGPCIEKPWKKAHMFESCLPLNEDTVSNYLECDVSKFLLEGIVGKNIPSK
jgi:hypothetical protein